MSWEECTLGDVVTLKRGHDLPNTKRIPGVVPVVSSSGITGSHNEAKAWPPGVVTGRYGTIGEVFYVTEPYWPLNTALYAIDFHGNDPRFVAYFLRNQLRNYQSDKAAVPGVDRNVLHKLPAKCPDSQIQQRIVTVLSAYDDLIENNRRRIALLEEAARLLYREWFVHFRFPGHEHVKIIDGVPEGWSIRLLPELCVGKNGIQTGPFGSQLHQSDYTFEGVPVVMPKDLKSFRISTDTIARIPEEKAHELGRHVMSVGDIVYGRRGDIGRRALIGEPEDGFFCGTGCLRIRPDATKIRPLYLFETLGSASTAGFIANQARGSTMLNLSAGALKNVPILCAPNHLQTDFVDLAGTIRKQIEILASQSDQLARARDLLLPRLMEGRLKV
jgi:type I restriction enzyme S subunit